MRKARPLKKEEEVHLRRSWDRRPRVGSTIPFQRAGRSYLGFVEWRDWLPCNTPGGRNFVNVRVFVTSRQ